MENNFNEISKIAHDSLEIGDKLFNDKKYEEALKQYNTALYNFSKLIASNNFHDHSRAYCSGKIAQCYIRLNNVNEAIHNFEASINLEPILEFIYNLTSIYYIDMDYDKTFVYSKILLETANKNLPSYDNEYYKNEAIKFLLDLENRNYEIARRYLTEYFKNIFVCNFESVILNTSFYFLSAEKGMWRDEDKNLKEINYMDNAYKNNCINFLENQIMSVKSHMRDHEFDNKFISYVLKNNTYDIVISEELLNAIKEVIIFKLNEKKSEFEESIY